MGQNRTSLRKLKIHYKAIIISAERPHSYTMGETHGLVFRRNCSSTKDHYVLSVVWMHSMNYDDDQIKDD